MRWIAGAGLVVFVLSACAPSASPEQLRTQATIAAAQSSGYAREARVIEAESTSAAIERARYQATLAAAAFTATPLPSSTPLPTATPEPTATREPLPTFTPAPSATPPQARAIVEPAPTATPLATPESAPRSRNIYDEWPLVFLMGAGALLLVVICWRLIDGKTIILPGRGEK